MKVKVVNNFIDKNTQELHKAGDIFECDAARYEEIQKRGNFVEKAVSSKSYVKPKGKATAQTE